MAPKKTAVGFARTSTEDQNISIEAQVDKIQAHCDRNNIELLAVYTEKGVSGGLAMEDREQLVAAVDHLGAEGADFFLVAKRDRLARDVMISAMIERLVQTNGGQIVSCDGVMSDNTPEGRMFRQIIDVFAEYERQLIKSRTRVALRQKKKNGEKLGGRVPFGWMKDPHGKLVQNDPEQVIVRKIKGMKTSMTYDDIVHKLYREGYLYRNKPFSRSTVVRICRQDYKSIGE